MSSTVVLDFQDAADAANLLSKGTITVDGVTKTLAELDAALKDNVITIPGYGSLNAADPAEVTLTLTAAAPAATYSFMRHSGTTAKLTAIDASGMTNAFTLDRTGSAMEFLASIKTGSGNDVLDVTGAAALTTIEAGDGDNTITMGDGAKALTAIKGGSGSDTIMLNEAAAGRLAVDLGIGGADTVVLAATQSAETTISNYIYSEGDVVKISGNGSVAAGKVTLAADGQLVFDESLSLGTTTVKAALESNVYKARVTGTTYGVEKTSAYWTVGTDSTAITLDASSMTNDVAMDASKAQSATVVSGMGNDSIKVSATGKTMITLGKASGSDSVNAGAKGLTTSQTLNLVGGSLENLTIGAVAGALDYVNTTLSGALTVAENKTTSGAFQVSFDGGTTTGKLQYAVGNLAAATDAVYFLGNVGGTTLQTTAGVNLQDTAHYKGITQVSVAAGGKGTFVGNADVGTAINGERATDSLTIWGGSKDVDTIVLGTQGKAADTLWFGKSDGNDAIAGFDAGFGSTADVLKLYDAASLADVTFTTEAANKKLFVKDGSSTASIFRAYGDKVISTDQDHILVELMDGTKKKVAVSLTTAGEINGVGADAVIGAAASAATNVVKYGATQTDAFTVDLNNTAAANTQYTNINDIDATDAAGDGTLVGKIGGSSTIKVGTGTNNIWAGSTDANQINLTAAKGTDIIWFGSTDGKDTVSNFQAATDTVRLYEASSAADIVKNYVFSAGLGAGTDTTTVALATATDDQVLTLKNAGAATSTTYNVTAGTASDSTVYKAALASVGTIAFATDTTIYGGGAAKVAAGNTVTGTVVVDLANAGSYGNYYFDSRILEFDASGSSAAFTLVGRGDKYSTIRGGAAKNDLWGGGYAKQDMYGNNAAVDTIWFGRNDGGDTVSTLDKGDTINLYDVASIGDVTMTKVDANNYSLSLGTSGLTINDTNLAALKGGLTFQTMDGSRYTYDTTNSRFAAKA